ncbi:hypothetical protein CP8484711_1933B, partial [Chlamydia psittaci 84-8471/1]
THRNPMLCRVHIYWRPGFPMATTRLVINKLSSRYCYNNFLQRGDRSKPCRELNIRKLSCLRQS